MIKVIDYGLGNVQAFLNIFNQLHIPAAAAGSPEQLTDATGLILPGVGHFDYAMQRFNASGLREKTEERVVNDKLPVLGVCVGMQIMAESSEEGEEPGLGWVHGSVRKLNGSVESCEDFPLPHMGWNSVVAERAGLFEGIGLNALRFYFLHSFVFECLSNENCLATTTYRETFCSAINKSNLFGVQFHPEKSHFSGVNLLKNFAELVTCSGLE